MPHSKLRSLLPVVLAIGCTSDHREVTTTQEVTFWADVHPILQARCAGCHQQGGIAPVSFDAATGDPATDAATAELVVEWAGRIEDSVTREIMPPWPATALTPATREQNLVTDAELAILAAWRTGGLALGDPASAPAITPREPFPITAPPDLVLDTGADYVPPGGAMADDYRCFAAPTNLAADRMLIGWKYLPGAPAEVHHAIVNLVDGADLAKLQALDAQTAEPGWPCSGAGVDASVARTVGRVGTFTPGKEGQVFFPGTASRVPAGAVVLFSVHYNTAHVPAPEADRSTLELFFAPAGSEATLERLGLISTTTRDIVIPAGAASTTITRELVVGDGVGTGRFQDGRGYVVGAFLHMHQIGVRARITLNKGLSAERVLLDIAPWSFGWQLDYTYVDPVPIAAGDTLSQECTYDNSREHRLAQGLDPASVEVRFGETSLDEMCLGNLFVIEELP